jgi:GDPmannose 4,6-dehydratase
MSTSNLRETLYGKKIDTANILSIADAKLVRDQKLLTNIDAKIVIVTGVTGQDGSHMIDYLLENTDTVIFGGVRRLSVYNHNNLSHIQSDRFFLVNFDLTDSHSIASLVEKIKPDYFINFAAQSFVASSWDFARQTWQTNCTAVLDILEAIRLYRPSCRFYNAGSSEEFGNVSYSPQDENHPLKPRSPYGASKAAARQIVKVYRDSYNLYAIQSWLFNHEGTRRGEEFVTRKISKGVARISFEMSQNQVPTPIELGNIYAKRDWSDSEDFVRCVWMMLNQEHHRLDLKSELYRVPIYSKESIDSLKEYVLSSNETHTIKEFIELAFSCLNISGHWIGSDIDEKFILNDTDIVLISINPNFYRPAEVELLLGNSNQFRNDFNWTPNTTFNELVKKMVANDHTLKCKSFLNK